MEVEQVKEDSEDIVYEYMMDEEIDLYQEDTTNEELNQRSKKKETQL